MHKQVHRTAAWPLLAVAFVPALVAALIAVLQSSKLQAPTTPAHCTIACADKLVKQVTDEQNSVLRLAWAAALVLLLIGAALALILARRSRRDEAVALERERAALVRACVEVSDVLSGALREQLLDGLAQAGVTPVQVAAGESFDSSRHHAVGRITTRDRARDNLVAETQRPGYVDHGKRMRFPDVVVFKVDGGLL